MWGVAKTSFQIEEYWDFLQISEPAGYGIRGAPAEVSHLGCGKYWNWIQRKHLVDAIAKTEKRFMKKRWLGYPLRRMYFGPVQLDYAWPAQLPHFWCRGVGVETETVLSANYALDLGTETSPNDPVTITLAVTFTDPDEIVIYYSNQTPRKYTIFPSKVQISEGIATIEIPRSRLLKRAYVTTNYGDNYGTGYTDTDRPPYSGTGANNYFEAAADVVRNYLDSTTGSNLVWRRLQSAVCCVTGFNWQCEPSAPCGEELQLACAYIRDQQLSEVQFEPAVYSNGAWARRSYAVCRDPDGLQVNYMAGYVDRYGEIPADLIRALIAVAHNNLPQKYCSCEVQRRYYEDDITTINPPVNFGLGPSTWGIKEASEIIADNSVGQGAFLA